MRSCSPPSAVQRWPNPSSTQRALDLRAVAGGEELVPALETEASPAVRRGAREVARDRDAAALEAAAQLRVQRTPHAPEVGEGRLSRARRGSDEAAEEDPARRRAQVAHLAVRRDRITAGQIARAEHVLGRPVERGAEEVCAQVRSDRPRHRLEGLRIGDVEAAQQQRAMTDQALPNPPRVLAQPGTEAIGIGRSRSLDHDRQRGPVARVDAVRRVGRASVVRHEASSLVRAAHGFKPRPAGRS